MSAQGKQPNEQKEPKPVVLSKDEALYPPNRKALALAVAAIVVGTIAVIASLVMYPPL